VTGFLLDANLAPRLARNIRDAGYDCAHVSELLSGAASDVEIAELANSTEAILITKDADFLDLARRGVLRGPQIRLRSGNMSNRQTAQLLISALPRCVAAIEAGERIIEIR
jgi:predicted nuclease of predicted toxin-antitoxin system